MQINTNQRKSMQINTNQYKLVQINTVQHSLNANQIIINTTVEITVGKQLTVIKDVYPVLYAIQQDTKYLIWSDRFDSLVASLVNRPTNINITSNAYE